MRLNVQAIYEVDSRELHLGEESVPVPDYIAETVDPDTLDLRRLARWAKSVGLIAATAHVAVCP